jgi:predicted Zn finger-like uncharacterized protein
MIAVCPKCTARYRVADEQLAKGELRLRCTRCEAVFRVRAPSPAAPSAGSTSSSTQPLEPAPRAPAGLGAGTRDTSERVPPGGGGAAPESTRTALVAHPDPEAGKRIAARLASLGFAPLLAHDGVEAVLLMQRRLPAVAVLDAALQGMSTAQLCELVKRNAELRAIRLVVTSEGTPRPDRLDADGFQPDRVVSRDRIEQEIESVLRGLDVPLAPSTVSGSAPPVAPVQTSPSTFAPPHVAATEDPLAAERAKAERLARIIVSDVILYNEEKFAQAILEGRVLDRLGEDLTEGRTLFRQRIDARVRDERDYLGDELLRVASTRRAKGPS